MRNKLAYPIVAFLAFLVLALTAYSASITRGLAVTVTTTQTVTIRSTSVTAGSHVWTDFFTVSGAGDKNTETFTTGGNIRLKWSYNTTSPQYASMAIYVYHGGDSVPTDSAQSGPGQSSDTTYLYLPAGQYYLKVLAANINSWKIELAQ